MPDALPCRGLHCGRFVLELDRPRVMGVINVTPDSFSDGGAFEDPARAVERARQMIADGADLIDVGGESTRPGAPPVAVEVELRRVLPVVQALARDGVPVSVDTRKVEVMRAALAEGAALVNDVEALADPAARALLARSDAAVCLVHMRGNPATMQAEPHYSDVVADVAHYLLDRAGECEAAGIAAERIVIDPGIGFGKTVEHNVALLRALPRLVAGGYPVMVGVSRKSTIGHITGRPQGERLAGSLGGALAAVAQGALFIRVHDVRETVDALRVFRAFRSQVADTPN